MPVSLKKLIIGRNNLRNVKFITFISTLTNLIHLNLKDSYFVLSDDSL